MVYNQNSFAFIHQKIPKIDSFVCKISKSPKEKPKTWEVQGELQQIKVGAIWQRPSIPWKLKCYFSKKMQKPRAGQVWLIADSVNSFDPPVFPFEKDWRQYYIEKGIIGSTFVQTNNSKVLRPFESQSYDSILKDWQTYFRKGLRWIPSKANREVAEAMVLGETEGIDVELQEAYTSLGAIHILSVSGMHLGILFLVVHLFFRKIQRYFPQLKTVLFVLLLLILWSYAGLTGFSAPVLRATWVFSLLLFARFFYFQINSINLLATSCWVLLLVNPYDLWSPGFQLSYLAVFGLLVFHKPIHSLFKIAKKSWIDYVKYYCWESTAVAIAAQILTLPLVIYYFYQMPNPFYFFLLNPILMLLSTIALIASFILLACFPLFTYLGSLVVIQKLSWLVNFFYEVMHQMMLYFSKGQASAISFLYLSEINLLGIYFVIFLIALWLYLRKVIFIWLLNMLMAFYLFHTLGLSSTIKPRYEKILPYRKDWVGVKIVNNQMLVVGPAKYMNDRKWFSSHLTPMAAHYNVRDTVLVIQ